MKQVLPFLETMITQSCQLSCTGCTNYSDLKHSGYVKWQYGKRDLEQWLERLDIPDFGIMGGEPLINPEVKQWLIGVRELMPNSQIRFTTNGLLLEKHWDIIELMHDLGNVSFKITAHTPELLEHTINKIMNMYEWRPVHEYGIDRLITTNQFRLHVKTPLSFLKTFRNDYADMMPCYSDHKQAFDSCIQQTCPLLYKGKIYKCSTSGLLSDTLAKFGNPNIEHWQQFIPKGISSTSDSDEIQDFIANFGKPNNICAQCPTHLDKEQIINHLDTVAFK